MKKTLLVLSSILVLVLLSFTVAAQLTVPSSLSFGSRTQPRGENVTAKTTVTNTGSSAVTINSVTPTSDSKYSVKVGSFTAVLNAGSSVEIPVTAFIALSHHAVNDNLEEVALSIGQLTIATSVGSFQVPLLMQAENRLRIRRGSIEFGGFSKSITDRSRVDNIKPGDNLQTELTVENTFPRSRSSSNDRDVDIDVRVTLRTDANDIDLTDDSDDFSLSPNDDQTVTFAGEVDSDADDRTNRLDIFVEGTDINGARHGEHRLLFLEVRRELHELKIMRADLSPTRVACEGLRAADLRVTMENRGRSNERDASIEVLSPSLDFAEKRTGLRIDQDERDSQTFSIPVKATVKSGVYQIDVSSFYSGTRGDTKTVSLTVDECKKELPKDEPKDEPQVITNTNTPVTPTVVVTQPPVVTQPDQGLATPVSSSFSDSPTYLVLLSILITLGVVAVIFFAVKFLILRP
jgi:hypothetical protein